MRRLCAVWNMWIVDELQVALSGLRGNFYGYESNKVSMKTRC